MTILSPEAATPSAWSPPHLGETETVTVSMVPFRIAATLDAVRARSGCGRLRDEHKDAAGLGAVDVKTVFGGGLYTVR